MIVATTPIEYICGDNPPTLPVLYPITPRLRVPVRLVGRPDWSPSVLTALAQGVVHPDQNTTSDTICAHGV